MPLLQLLQKGSKDFLLASFLFGGSDRLRAGLSDSFLSASDLAQLSLVSLYLFCIVLLYIKQKENET